MKTDLILWEINFTDEERGVMSGLLSSTASLEGDEHGPGLHPQISQDRVRCNWFAVEGKA